MKILITLLGLLRPGAGEYAVDLVQVSDHYQFDPLLVVSIAWRETRLKRGHCYRGSHGLMQVQLKGKSCRGTLAEAEKRKLYDPRANFTRGLELAQYWRKWGRGKSYHWLLHYNQGFGLCPDGSRRCPVRRRVPIQTGRIGGYADRVLRFYQRLKGVVSCLRKGKAPSICRRGLRQQRRSSSPPRLPNS